VRRKEALWAKIMRAEFKMIAFKYLSIVGWKLICVNYLFRQSKAAFWPS